MSVVDWIIMGVIVISTLLSIRRGFLKEALSLGTLIVAIFVARVFGSQVSTLLIDVIEIPSVRAGIAYGLLFFGTLVIGGLINRLLSEVVKMSGLGGTDRFLGMFFGLARGGLIVLVGTAFLHYLVPVEEDGWYRESVLLPHFVTTVEWLGPILWEQGGQLIDGSQGVT